MQSDSGTGVPLKRMVAIGLGNALEFYDFMLSSFFAVQISHTFFPKELAGQGLLLTLATFGVGFFTRPLGGIVIGRYGRDAVSGSGSTVDHPYNRHRLYVGVPGRVAGAVRAIRGLRNDLCDWSGAARRHDAVRSEAARRQDR